MDERRRYMREIDRQGGAVNAIENGYMQREITESAYKYQKEVEREGRIVVGVNEFRSKTEAPIRGPRVDPAVERRVVERLNRVKRTRKNGAVRDALEKLRTTAEEENENLLPPTLDAVKEFATVGEICGALRGVYGEYRPSTIF